MKVVKVAEAASTNTMMRDNAADYGHGDVLIAHSQTAGRGQRGNSWESEPGRNLTFSLMLMPSHIRPAKAFVLSMAVSVGVVNALRKISGLPVMLKWPNDIYVGDKKLVGILIENSFGSEVISHSIVGIGVNVNQTVFVSDAPNPVSLANLCSREFDLDEMLNDIVESVLAEFAKWDAPEADTAELVAEYRSMMWRGQGVWPWIDVLRGERIEAAITSVAESGHLTLGTNPPRTYAFKELAAVLKKLT